MKQTFFRNQREKLEFIVVVKVDGHFFTPLACFRNRYWAKIFAFLTGGIISDGVWEVEDY